MSVVPPQLLYMMLSWIPHEVADWLKRWLGVDAEGTAVYILLMTTTTTVVSSS